MKTSSAKNKGRRLQQKIRQMIIDKFGVDEVDVISTSMGAPGVDIKMSSEVMKMLPISIECKNSESMNAVYTWMKQAKSNCHPRTYPAIIRGSNRHDPLIIMEFKDFLDMKGGA